MKITRLFADHCVCTLSGERNYQSFISFSKGQVNRQKSEKVTVFPYSTQGRLEGTSRERAVKSGYGEAWGGPSGSRKNKSRNGSFWVFSTPRAVALTLTVNLFFFSLCSSELGMLTLGQLSLWSMVRSLWAYCLNGHQKMSPKRRSAEDTHS